MIKMYFTKTGRPIKPYPKPTNSKRFIDATGKTFGRLTVVKYLGRCYRATQQRYSSYDHIWIANCSCGVKDVPVRGSNLGRYTNSCGCLHLEKLRKRSFIHGGAGATNADRTSTYLIWSEMRSRCNNPKHKDFKNYGGRGITVCESWNQFKNFLDDMGERPPRRSLDRTDNNGNYEKGNCRWATQKEQCRNTRVNHIVEFNGRKQSIAAWAEEYGMKSNTLHSRLCRSMWSVGKALTTPVRKKPDK